MSSPAATSPPLPRRFANAPRRNLLPPRIVAPLVQGAGQAPGTPAGLTCAAPARGAGAWKRVKDVTQYGRAGLSKAAEAGAAVRAFSRENLNFEKAPLQEAQRLDALEAAGRSPLARPEHI